MILADVMDELAARLATLPGLRAYAYPTSRVSPPAAVVTFPDGIDYDAAMADGADRMTVPIVLLFSRVSDRTSRDLVSAWLDRCGGRRYRIENTPQLTKFTFSVDGAHASSPSIAGVNPGNPAPTGNLQVVLSAGSSQGTSNLRDVYIRSAVAGTDFRGRATFDPPFFGDPDVGGPLNPILPQHGLVFRYQRDTVQRAVMIWQNITFSVPQLFVGVWKANLDGTGFTNRQAPGWPAPFGLAFPYTVEARLRGNTVEVRQWHVGDPVPPWNDPALGRRFNLDTDCGDAVAIPTPVGSGSAGLLAAHLGVDTSPPSMVRYRLADTYLELDAESLKDFLEVNSYSAFDSCRVMQGEFDMVSLAGIEYLAVTLSVDVIGTGA